MAFEARTRWRLKTSDRQTDEPSKFFHLLADVELVDSNSKLGPGYEGEHHGDEGAGVIEIPDT